MTRWLAIILLALVLIGFVMVAAYSFSRSGPHWQHFGVGVLAGLAALSVGCILGFLFGIPRVVSSGALRIQSTAGGPQAVEIA
jgi:hypothetical protein